MADLLIVLSFDLALAVLAAVLACLRVLRCTLSRPQKRKTAGDA
jgi:hypothetical protein